MATIGIEAQPAEAGLHGLCLVTRFTSGLAARFVAGGWGDLGAGGGAAVVVYGVALLMEGLVDMAKEDETYLGEGVDRGIKGFGILQADLVEPVDMGGQRVVMQGDQGGGIWILVQLLT